MGFFGYFVSAREAGYIFLKNGGSMAQFEHLPIYKKAYDLVLYFEKGEQKVSKVFPYHKSNLHF